MQIDHDKNEPSRRALKIMALISLVITIAIMLVLAFGLRKLVDSLPSDIVSAFVGLVAGLIIGMKLGWWDCERYYSTMPDKVGTAARPED